MQRFRDQRVVAALPILATARLFAVTLRRRSGHPPTTAVIVGGRTGPGLFRRFVAYGLEHADTACAGVDMSGERVRQ